MLVRKHGRKERLLLNIFRKDGFDLDSIALILS